MSRGMFVTRTGTVILLDHVVSYETAPATRFPITLVTGHTILLDIEFLEPFEDALYGKYR